MTEVINGDGSDLLGDGDDFVETTEAPEIDVPSDLVIEQPETVENEVVSEETSVEDTTVIEEPNTTEVETVIDGDASADQ